MHRCHIQLRSFIHCFWFCLSVLIPAENKAKFGESNGVETLLNVFKEYKSNAAIMEEACGAVCTVCVHCGMF